MKVGTVDGPLDSSSASFFFPFKAAIASERECDLAGAMMQLRSDFRVDQT